MIIHQLGLTDYLTVYKAMRAFTDKRDHNTPDELWITEHNPVFTQGLSGKVEHILAITDIPIIQTDRGGQITYHGPKQIVFYPLIDIKRNHLGPRALVTLLEEATIKTLKIQAIDAYSKPDAPGVYVDYHNETHKIASLGLRIRKGCSYHGLSLNIDMDLTPFKLINPCGYQGLKMINSTTLNPQSSFASIVASFTKIFMEDYQNRIKQNVDV